MSGRKGIQEIRFTDHEGTNFQQLAKAFKEIDEIMISGKPEVFISIDSFAGEYRICQQDVE